MLQETKFKYQKVTANLQKQMTCGVLIGKENLPSELSLTKFYKVNRRTIRRALNELERYGLVSSSTNGKRKILAQNLQHSQITVAFVAYGDISQNKINNLCMHRLFDELVLKFQRHHIKVIKILFDQNRPNDIPDIVNFPGIDVFLLAGDVSPQVFQDKKYKFILIDSGHFETKTINIVPDSAAIATEAYRYLFSCGSKKIGFLRYNIKYFPYSDMWSGFRNAAESSGQEPLLFEIPFTFDNDVNYFVEHLRKIAPKLIEIDALVLCTTVDAQKIIFALQEIGISIPSRLSIVAIGGYANPRTMIPKLSCFENNYSAMAKTIWEITLSVFSGTLSPPLRISCNAFKFFDGNSIINHNQ